MKTASRKQCFRLLGFIALLAIIGFAITGCPEPNRREEVIFNNVTANGSSGSVSTTQLTLTFNKPIADFNSSDITITGVSGVSWGQVGGSGPEYTLPISGFTSGGQVTVSLSKSRFVFNPSARDVTIHYFSGDIPTPVTFVSVTANGASGSELTTQLTFTFNNAISGFNANDITITGVSGVSKGTLSGSGPVYTLPISGFTTDGTLSVSVSKTGFNFSGSPQQVGIFYVMPNLTGTVTLSNLSPKVGDTINAQYAGNGSGTATWQWFRGNEQIPSTNNDYYQVTEFDVDHTLKAQVAWSGQNGFIESDATAVVPEIITYSVVQTGGEDGVATTTGLEFEFSASINNFETWEIQISNEDFEAIDFSGATLSGSGTTWELSGFDIGFAGLIYVYVNKSGIEQTYTQVVVYKEGETAPEYFTITWHLNGGIQTGGSYPTLIEGEDNIWLPNPSKEGNRFDGWYYDETLTDFAGSSGSSVSDVQSNIDLYAKWLPQITYTVEQVGGGSGVATSTGLKFTFDESISDSIALDFFYNMQITGAVEIPRYTYSNSYSGSGDTWTLNVEVLNQGTAYVSTSYHYFEQGVKTVEVYYVPEFVVDININFNAPNEELGNYLLNAIGDNLTFSVDNADEFGNFKWVLDGDFRSETTSSLELNKSDLEPSMYRLTVIATKISTGTVYSKEYIFGVE